MDDLFRYTIERLEIIELELINCKDDNRRKNIETIKNNILTFMRKDFKIINSRDVVSVGYDPEKHICLIHYNHVHSGKSLYYQNITQEQFEELLKSDNISLDVDRIFSNKINK